MSVPKHAPVPPLDDARGYESPDHVPEPWMPDRPAMIRGFQPEGGRLGYQGPDQGFGIKVARTFLDRLHLAPGEEGEDAMTGCLAIGLRRASLFGRAPVVHDFTIAYTVWGYLDAAAPAELVAVRRPLFAGLAHVAHHYSEIRALVDMVPEATLRMTPQQVAGGYPARWRELTGA